MKSLIVGFCEHFFVFLHLCLNLSLRVVEDLLGLPHQVGPKRLSVHSQVLAHTLDQLHKFCYTSVHVGQVGVGGGAQNMRHLRGLVVLDEVPSFLVRSILVDELAFLVLLDAEFNRVLDLLLFVALLIAHLNFHLCALALLKEMVLDALCDGFNVEHLSRLARCESLKQDEVLDILQHLHIDASKGTSACKPDILSILVVLVVVLPDPGPLLKQINTQYEQLSCE